MPTDSTRTLVERVAEAIYIAGAYGTGRSFESVRHTSLGKQLMRKATAAIEATLTHQQKDIEALKGENARLRQQGQDEGFASAVQQLRDMSATKPRGRLADEANALADMLEQSRIPRAQIESPKP